MKIHLALTAALAMTALTGTAFAAASLNDVIQKGDAANKVIDTVNTCPGTKIVLGGYSQGAAIAAYITSDSVPPGYTLPAGISGPLPPNVAPHVAARVRALELDVEAVAEHLCQQLAARRCKLAIAGAERHRDRAVRPAGQRDDVFGIAREPIELDVRRLVHRRFEKGA